VFLDEVERFVERGQTVVVYHHQTRERGGLAAQIQAYFVLPAVATAGS
jgi:GTP cyclohydrolase II